MHNLGFCERRVKHRPAYALLKAPLPPGRNIYNHLHHRPATSTSTPYLNLILHLCRYIQKRLHKSFRHVVLSPSHCFSLSKSSLQHISFHKQQQQRPAHSIRKLGRHCSCRTRRPSTSRRADRSPSAKGQGEAFWVSRYDKEPLVRSGTDT